MTTRKKGMLFGIPFLRYDSNIIPDAFSDTP